MEKIRIAIADDHSIVREGLRIILRSDSRFSVEGIYSTGGDLLSAMSENPIDLIILDIDIPGEEMFSVLKLIKKSYPNCKVIIFTMHSNLQYFLSAINFGANSYVLKTESVTFMPSVVMFAMKGTFYASPELKNFMESTGQKSLLSPTELEIVNYISKGTVYRDIAQKIGRSEKTVEYYAKRIRKKLNVKTNSEMLISMSTQNRIKQDD